MSTYVWIKSRRWYQPPMTLINNHLMAHHLEKCIFSSVAAGDDSINGRGQNSAEAHSCEVDWIQNISLMRDCPHALGPCQCVDKLAGLISRLWWYVVWFEVGVFLFKRFCRSARHDYTRFVLFCRPESRLHVLNMEKTVDSATTAASNLNRLTH